MAHAAALYPMSPTVQCDFTNTLKVMAALHPAAAEMLDCHASAEAVHGHLEDFRGGVETANDVAQKLAAATTMVADVVSWINELPPKGSGVAQLLGSIPKYGMIIKTGLKIADRTTEGLDRVMHLLARRIKYLKKGVVLTETAFSALVSVTGPTSAVLSAYDQVLTAAYRCASSIDDCSADTLSVLGAKRLEKENEHAVQQDHPGDLGDVEKAGKVCVAVLNPMEAVMKLLAWISRQIQQLLAPVQEVLDAVIDFVRFLKDQADKLLNSDAVQCITDIFKPVTKAADLLTCPIDEVTERVMREIFDPLETALKTLINKASDALITKAVDALIPDDLIIHIPDFTRLMPLDAMLAVCTAAELKWEGLGAADQLARLQAELPYTFDSNALEEEVLQMAVSGSRLALPPSQGFESPCKQAWEEFLTYDKPRCGFFEDIEAFFEEDAAKFFEDAKNGAVDTGKKIWRCTSSVVVESVQCGVKYVTSAAECGTDTLVKSVQCGTKYVTSAAECGTDAVIKSVQCGTKYVTSAADCGTSTVMKSVQCGTQYVTSAADCGTNTVWKSVQCGTKYVTSAADCGTSTVWKSVQCGTKYVTSAADCGTSTVTNTVQCGYETVTSGVVCGWNWFTGLFGGKSAKSCRVPKTCSQTSLVAKSCNIPKYCNERTLVAKSCNVPKYCNERTLVPKTCSIPKYCNENSLVAKSCNIPQYCNENSLVAKSCNIPKYCDEKSLVPKSCNIPQYCDHEKIVKKCE